MSIKITFIILSLLFGFGAVNGSPICGHDDLRVKRNNLDWNEIKHLYAEECEHQDDRREE